MLRSSLAVACAALVGLSATDAHAQRTNDRANDLLRRAINELQNAGQRDQRSQPAPRNAPTGRNSSGGLTVRGVEFPQGSISFADEVVSFRPGSSAPSAPHRGAENALGVPDWQGGVNCRDASSCTYVSLGSGGSLVLRFIDNVLTGSGNNDIDLWVFEVGPDVEDMAVDISSDGVVWHSVGSIGGATSGVDIDAFGFGPNAAFSYVRLTDDPMRGGRSGATVGADVDAVGAISTRTAANEGCTCPPAR